MSETQSPVNLRKHAEWMVKSGQFVGTVDQYLAYFRPRYTDEQWQQITKEPDAPEPTPAPEEPT